MCVCHDKHFVMTNIILSGQKSCHGKQWSILLSLSRQKWYLWQFPPMIIPCCRQKAQDDNVCFLWDGAFEANTPCCRQKEQDDSVCLPGSAWPLAAPGYDWETCWHHPGISRPHERSSWVCLPPPAPSAPGIPARDSICLSETLFYDTARFLHGILSVFRRHLLKHCTGHSCKRFRLRETV